MTIQLEKKILFSLLEKKFNLINAHNRDRVARLNSSNVSIDSDCDYMDKK